ncbi:predicted protein [Naegleria gruberi]|uniref:Predicted protein n=1 Tax=Naegleria gruberi TaxID=5762 RepID=D2VI92_NAEGR|nr:uncharacterized protein NAEGRDRAFT_68604 [Naegleria gruberi]EFC43555.1 predicted protein [Naegleria gruberi]|eukprot:XP_002676299.1 predicted protein [Naegleria gruberi strain NEG-M]
MALSGYMFDNYDDVFPYCEEQGKGSCYEFCKNLSEMYDCAVVCGYPEKEQNQGSAIPFKLFNSIYIVSADGSFVNYRKHFLYEQDMKWAQEGEEFKSFILRINDKKILEDDPVDDEENCNNYIRVGAGICMDINNGTDFSTDYYAKEFANFHKDKESELILFAANWLANRDDPSDCLSTQSYWVERMAPIMKSQPITYFAACNRTGIEKDTQFAGASCVLMLNKKRPVILQDASHDEECVKVREIYFP